MPQPPCVNPRACPRPVDRAPASRRRASRCSSRSPFPSVVLSVSTAPPEASPGDCRGRGDAALTPYTNARRRNRHCTKRRLARAVLDRFGGVRLARIIRRAGRERTRWRRRRHAVSGPRPPSGRRLGATLLLVACVGAGLAAAAGSGTPCGSICKSVTLALPLPRGAPVESVGKPLPVRPSLTYLRSSALSSRSVTLNGQAFGVSRAPARSRRRTPAN